MLLCRAGLGILPVTFFLLAGCGTQSAILRLPASAPAQAQRASQLSGDLLYVDDIGVDEFGAYVLVYTYPGGKHVDTLTGFNHLTGECSDTKGNVFILAPGDEQQYSDLGPTTIYEYAHGGSSPIASFTETGYGLGCAIDPTTGNLAVANPNDEANPYHKGYGDIAVFAGGSSEPTMYYSSTFSNFWYCSYDDKGNLYLSAGVSGGYELARLGPGSGSIEAVDLTAQLYGATLLVPRPQWDGNKMTVSSTLTQVESEQYTGPVNLYGLKISGNKAKIIKTTRLDAPQRKQRGETWIQGNTVIGVDYNHGWPYVEFWSYPSGGEPTHGIKHKQYPPGSLLWGVTVSVAPKH